MSKRPAFQFYPGDWRNDPALRLCSIAARGLWMDMLCLMHEGEPYGHLTVQGRVLTADALARLAGEGAATVKRWLKELGENEVYSLTDDGVIFSRRMVRDEELRERRAAGGQAGAGHGAKGGSHGSKGGRPRKNTPPYAGNEGGFSEPPSEPPPSSSSPSPSSDQGSVAKATVADATDLDAQFWANAKAHIKPHTKDDPGKLIGKWLREQGKELTAGAITASQLERSVNPMQFIPGYFRRHAKSMNGAEWVSPA